MFHSGTLVLQRGCILARMWTDDSWYGGLLHGERCEVEPMLQLS